MKHRKLHIRVSTDKKAGSYYVYFRHFLYSLIIGITRTHRVEDAKIFIDEKEGLAGLEIPCEVLPAKTVQSLHALESEFLKIDNQIIQLKFKPAVKTLVGDIAIDLDDNDEILGIDIP